MHEIVEQNVSEYLEQNRDIRKFFDRLVAAGKKLFLVTNSPYRFVWVTVNFISLNAVILFTQLLSNGYSHLIF